MDERYKKAVAKALSLLNRRSHTSSELKRKLVLKGFAEDEAEAAVAQMKEYELLNDERFAEVFLENLINYKTFGYYMLKLKLKQRGIAEEEITRLLSEKFGLPEELLSARRAVEKSGKSDKLKIGLMLKRKGFRSAVIQEILKEI